MDGLEIAVLLLFVLVALFGIVITILADRVGVLEMRMDLREQLDRLKGVGLLMTRSQWEAVQEEDFDE